ncbi:hypothetical protein [Ktedonobacter racemifer]|uniref:Uncharacterized protein n=1 Tax=Ktedonobacter racemifer DSM 44963 TaxID=485913 RepID=D6TZV9_KTERA|nr:hypothetical protein [Ktedonobacter racemifer]EFH82099.1 hypothetical protein Krac_2876 [Ktedonobacter racemifer DSM 44963]
MSDSKTFGFLRTCMDKRFVAATRAAFERASGLSSNDYWHESYAGGSAVPAANNVGEEYAAEHGAAIFGWQAHINNCGGQPGVSDQEIEQRLDSVIQEKVQKYPQARHFRIVASEAGIDIREVSQ